MSFKTNSFGNWAGGKPRPNLARSLGAFTKFSQIKTALLRPGIDEGITATLVGLDGLEIATFERQLNPSLEPEVRLYGQHIHADRIIPDVSFTVGAGEDIEFIPVNGGGGASTQSGGILTTGGVHVLCRFCGFFRGPGFFVSAQVDAGFDSPGNGAYMGAGFQYANGALAVCAGVGQFPAGWHRLALLGDPALPLTLSGVTFIQRKVATPAAIATPESWQLHSEAFRAAGDLGSLVGGGWREDGSDAGATQNFAQDSADYGLSNEDRQLILVSYPSGGDSNVLWSHIHVSDADTEVAE